MNEYEEAVKEVLSGRVDMLELDCEDNAFGLPEDMLENEVEDNIRCILERAGLWAQDLTVSVGSLPVDVECDEETGSCFIKHDFTVYKDNGWEDLAHGVAVSRYYPDTEDKTVDVAETYIVMGREEVQKLYNHVKMKALKA